MVDTPVDCSGGQDLLWSCGSLLAIYPEGNQLHTQSREHTTSLSRRHSTCNIGRLTIRARARSVWKIAMVGMSDRELRAGRAVGRCLLLRCAEAGIVIAMSTDTRDRKKLKSAQAAIGGGLLFRKASVSERVFALFNTSTLVSPCSKHTLTAVHTPLAAHRSTFACTDT